MAFWFGDGFDLYSNITDCGTYWDASFGSIATLGLSASGRFAGSRSLLVSSASTANPYILKTSAVNDAVHHVSLAINCPGALSGLNTTFYMTLFDGSTSQCTILIRSDGAMLLNSGASNGSTLATYTGAIAASNTWYQFEIEVVINNTTGSIAVRKNGNISNDFFLGSLNTRNSANNYANKIGLGCANQSQGHVIDDFLWRSDAASVPWVGDIRCYTRMPQLDSSAQWVRSGSVVPITPLAQGSQSTTSATVPRYQPFTALCDGAVGTVIVSLGAADTGNMKCSIFASSGSAPTAVLGSATPLSNLPSGSNTFTFSTPVAVTRGTQYWVGFATDTVVTNGWNASTSITAGLTGTGSPTYASFPVANPATTTAVAVIFTANITPTTIANAQFVAEPQQDLAATYVYSSTVSQSDLYTIGSIASTPATIIGVTTRGYMQKSDAGTRNATVQLKSGSTTVQGTSTALPSGSWQWISRTDLTDPATSAAWTATGVNNVTIGPIVTA